MTKKCPKCGKGVKGKISPESMKIIKELEKRVNYDFDLDHPRICCNCLDYRNKEVGMVPRIIARTGMGGELAFYIEYVCYDCGTRYGDYYEEIGILDEPGDEEGKIPIVDEKEWRERKEDGLFSAGREITLL